jgi:hypothetical protein
LIREGKYKVVVEEWVDDSVLAVAAVEQSRELQFQQGAFVGHFWAFLGIQRDRTEWSRKKSGVVM